MRIKGLIANLRSFDFETNSHVGTKGNVKRRVWRIWILMLGYKELKGNEWWVERKLQITSQGST